MKRTSTRTELLAMLALSVLAGGPSLADERSHQGPEDHHPKEVDPQGDHEHAAHPPHGNASP